MLMDANMTTPRTRVRNQPYSLTMYSSTGSVLTHVTDTMIREEISDFRKKPGPCTHTRVQPLSYAYPMVDGRKKVYNGYCFPLVTIRRWVYEAIGSNLTKLDRTHLPSTNDASILSILAEIDDTLGMFTKKFLAGGISYGSTQWGILPLVSDMFAIAKTIQNLSVPLKGFRYTDKDQINNRADKIPVTNHDDWYKGDFLIELRRNGSGDISDTPAYNTLFDRLGFHPDLATVWDLTPYSFLVDYALPIGNYLESWRGWTSNMTYTGWRSITVKDGLFFSSTQGPSWVGTHTIPLKFDYYARLRENAVSLRTMPETMESLQAPTFPQMVNIAYVAATSVLPKKFGPVLDIAAAATRLKF